MPPGHDWSAAVESHLAVIGGMRTAGPRIDAIATLIIERLKDGSHLYLAGNGGSAADAQHVAAELTGRFKTARRPLPAIALTTDTSALTAIGNDFGFEQVFERQVRGLVRPGDVLWAFSTSGNSPNILRALGAAREIGAKTVGFSGRTGGRMADMCDLLLCVPHDESDRIQEGHQLAYHFVCGQIDAAFADR
ncbi:MAG: D-sedoheptulose 7-phosphate isomerase [Planctomycetia bacterium]|nr:MAG: D-sedoheptulose 7-phosphate isomerase [Planctomycetia bacterium]